MIINSIFRKPTIFSIAGFLTIIFGIPFGIYAFTLDGFKAILGTITFMYLIAAGILVYFDRVFVRRISLLKVNILELFISFVIICFYLSAKSNLKVNITDENIDYLLIIENPGNLENDKLNSIIPRDMNIDTDRNYIIIDEMPDNVDCIISASWSRNFYYKTFEFEKYQKVKLYSKNKMIVSEEFIDSLIAKK